MISGRSASFLPETLSFLEELEKNNDREWFQANKSRYEQDVLDPALRFIAELQEPLTSIAPSFVAQPSRIGGSLMRVYRDTRFSRNKLPYKTNIGIQFRHEQGRNVHAPGYYLHIEPRQVFVGVGTWRPEAAPLRAIRERIAARPDEWRRVLGDRAFRRHFELGGELLTRPPRGFAADHEFIEDIKRKSFIAMQEFDTADCLRPRFGQQVIKSFETGEPLMRFLCKAVGVPF